MFPARRTLLLAGLFATGLLSLTHATAQPPTALKKDPPASILPPGATARLGHTRLRHAEPPTCVAFAPDGKTFVTGGNDETVRVWSVATGDQVNVLQKPGYKVSAVRFTHGGKRLAVYYSDNSVHFLDPQTLTTISTLDLSNRHLFAFSQDGKLMATSDFAETATVTEVDSNLPKLELPNAGKFDFRPDNKAIAAGDAKGNFGVYLVTGGKPIFTAKQDGAVTGVAYSPDGKRLAVAVRTRNGSDAVRVYEGTGEKPVAEIEGMNVVTGWIGTDSLAVGNGADAGVYDLKKKEWTGKVVGASGAFAVSPDGKYLAATGTGGLRVRLWDLSTGKQLHAENDTFPDPALMAASADGKSLFLLAADAAYIWPVGVGGAKPAGKLPGRAVAATVLGDRLLLATPEAVILYEKFDPAKPLPAKPTVTFKDSAGATAVAITSDGSRVAWGTPEGKVFLVDPADTGKRREVADGDPNHVGSRVLALGFNPAGNRLAVLSFSPFLRLWDVSGDEGECQLVWQARIQRGQKGTIAFTPDGKYLTAVSTAQLLLFDGIDQKPSEEFRKPAISLERYSEQGRVIHAAFTPDSRLLVVGTDGPAGGVEVWELATRSLVKRFITGYGGITRTTLFPDGTRVASAGAEEAITVWDLTFRTGKAAPTVPELQAAWKNLDAPDAATGYPAVRAYIAAGNKGVEELDRGLKEIVANEKKIKELIVDLGSETFSVREAASKELLEMGARALPAVMGAAKSEDPEVRDRANELIGRFGAKGIYPPTYGLPGDSLRLVRIVNALEAIGTPEAKKLLEQIAALNGRPADEAKAALARLKKK